MSVLEKLATSLGRKDEVPNQELAKQIVASYNELYIEELILHLTSHKDKKIQSDCIKVLYEVGEAKPILIAQYYPDFLKLLKNKNNRLVWGSMAALDVITDVSPHTILDVIPHILDAIEKGSVITKDHGMSILIKLSAHQDFKEYIFPIFLEQLKICAFKQVPMYAEKALTVIDVSIAKPFITVLENRINDMEKETQKNRITKVLKKVNQIIED